MRRNPCWSLQAQALVVMNVQEAEGHWKQLWDVLQAPSPVAPKPNSQDTPQGYNTHFYLGPEDRGCHRKAVPALEEGGK